MPRIARQAPGGIVYHVLNRAAARLPLFEKPADYAAFLNVVADAVQECPMRILAFVLMPNHWHFILWPKDDGDLSAFCRWMTHTHSMRWHAHHHTAGSGHLYQGRFKSFPVQSDDHFYTVCRYVERNPLRAKLVGRAEQWRWSSLWRRLHGDAEPGTLLSPWPLPEPTTWLKHVHEAQSEAELEALRRSVQRGVPFGAPAWQKRTATRLFLGHTLRPPGRPKKVASPGAPVR